MQNIGIIYALLAYLIWGLVPLFWKQLADVDSAEIVAHRVVWSWLMVMVTILLLRKGKSLLALFSDKKMLVRLFFASALISLNWGIYIWAINSGNVVESSMGYFINPFINVLFGVVLFSEQLNKNQWFALGLAGIGVGYLIVFHGDVPYIALSLAGTFACYGVLKKTLQIDALGGMAFETGLLLIPAIVFLIYLSIQNQLAFGVTTKTDVYLILGGAVTLIPLLFFAAAAKRISMTALGMTQYLGPTLQLLIGVWIYQEPFGSERQIAFGFIWAGLLVYTLDQLNARRQRRKKVRAPM